MRVWSIRWHAVGWPGGGCVVSSGRIFGIPILGCPAGTLDASSTISRCNENGMHAARTETKKRKRISHGAEKMLTKRVLRKWWPVAGPAKEEATTKLTLQTPQATVHSSLVADAWFAWHSMHKSIMWLRQMAQLSTTISVVAKRKTRIQIKMRRPTSVATQTKFFIFCVYANRIEVRRAQNDKWKEAKIK